MIAALRGDLKNVAFDQHSVFGLAMPAECPGVPFEILNPRNTWADKKAYDEKANWLAMSSRRISRSSPTRSNRKSLPLVRVP